MPIDHLFKPPFRDVQGGLFSKVTKADVGDGAVRLMRQGVTLLCWADPFFPDPSTPPPVREAALKAIQGGQEVHYTMPIGSPELKEAIGSKLRRQGFAAIDPQRNILVTPGSDAGLFYAMFPFLCPGDEVLIPDPSYPNNFQNAKLTGAVAVPVPLDEAKGFRLDVGAFESRCTDRTKMVVLTNPNNPTSTVFSQQEIQELCRFIVRRDLVLVVDQAFEDILFDGRRMTHAALEPGMWERTVTVCSCSKGMALSGYRVGYIFADDVIMDTMYATAVNIQGAANTMVQMAMIPAYEDTSFIQDYVAEQDFRRRYAYEKFNAVPGVSMPLMESGFYGWVNVSRLGDSSEITAYLAEEAKTLVNDGKFYGDQGAGHLRIIYGVFADRQKSLDGIDRLCEALAKRAAQLGITE